MLRDKCKKNLTV